MGIIMRGATVFLEGLMAGFYKGFILVLIIVIIYLLYRNKK